MPRQADDFFLGAMEQDQVALIRSLIGNKAGLEELIADLKNRDGDKRSIAPSKPFLGNITWNNGVASPNLFNNPATDIGGAMFGPTFSSSTLGSVAVLFDLSTNADKKLLEKLTLVGIAVDVSVVGHVNTAGGPGAPFDGRYLEQIGELILQAYEIAVMPSASDTNPFLGFTDCRALYCPEGEMRFQGFIPCFCEAQSARIILRPKQTGVFSVPLPNMVAAGDVANLTVVLSVYLKTIKEEAPANI